MATFLTHSRLQSSVVHLLMITYAFARNSSRAEVAAGISFPWHHESCDVATVSAEQFDTAFAVQKSMGGTMGGVYFLALKPDCVLVVKPKVDLHDVFANTLAGELGAPVVKSKAVKKSDPLFKGVLSGLKKTQEDFVEWFLEDAGGDNGNGYIQLMAKASGKDPYNHLKGLQFDACEACKDEAIEQAIASEVKPIDDEIEAKIVSVENIVKSGGTFRFKAQQTMVSKALGKDYAKELEDADEATKDNLAGKLRTWMLENLENRANILNSIYDKNKRDKDSKALQFGRDCRGWNYGEQQTREEVEASITYVREAWLNKPKLVAALIAFASLVGEYDSLPAPGFGMPVGNMMNVMVSPTSIEGIDIAVGGATEHKNIRQDGTGGAPIDSVKPFFLRQAAREGLCEKPEGIDPEETDKAEESLRLRLRMPFFIGMFHKYNQQCHVEHSSVVTEEEAKDLTTAITREMWHAFREYLGKMHRAVAMTSARLSGFGSPEEMMNIVGWLMHRIDKFQKQLDEADALCPQGLPSSPIVSENHGSSLDGKEPPIPPTDGKEPPRPPAFNKHSKKMGYVWHTVETMWKQGHGQWFGTRTTDIVAVPLKPAQSQ